MAAQLGTATVLKSDGVIIAKGKTLGFSQSVDMVDITNKDSGGYKQFLPADKTATFQFEGLFDETISATAGFGLLNTKLHAGTAITALFYPSTGTTYSYSAYVSNLERNAPEGDVETFSCTLQCTGAPL